VSLPIELQIVAFALDVIMKDKLPRDGLPCPPCGRESLPGRWAPIMENSERTLR